MSREPLILTPAWWEAIVAVNVNEARDHPYQMDPPRTNRWFFPKPGERIVCIQMALGKLKALVDIGCPAGALRLILCTVVNDDGTVDIYLGDSPEPYKVPAKTALKLGWCNHAMLGLEAVDQGKEGTFLLDNRKPGLPLGPEAPFYANYLYIEELWAGEWIDKRSINTAAAGLELQPLVA